jgi:non-specific serine/threonine protein kinase
VEAFEAAAGRARQAHDPEACRAALALYAGDLLPADRYEDWASEPRERLRQQYVALLCDLADLHEARQEYALASDLLRQVLVQEPAHEPAQRRLMRLYALLGQRQQALRQYAVLQETLQRELGVEPDADSRRLYEDVVASRFPPPERPDPTPRVPRVPLALAVESPTCGPLAADPPHNLPAPLTSFVGRERELAEVERLLGTTRLLTLTGVGGGGKTRLALQVARAVLARYPDGVWLVELAALADPALVPQAAAAALGVQEQAGRPLRDTLVAALKARELLLVLDNCEHLLVGCAELAETLLQACPRLRVLATSREPLRVPGEVAWRVPSLTLPAAQQEAALEDLLHCESVRLFDERARSALPAFAVAEQDPGALAYLSRRLDGIPLAIELAAARVSALSVAQLATRLDGYFRLLTGGSRTALPRQQTLQATLDWSHALLAEAERVLFRRLAVFAGGLTLEAAEAVCAGDGLDEAAVLDLLSGLVDKSLVLAEVGEAGLVRYRLLEPLRQYARDHLRAAGEAERVQERHAAWYLALAEQAEPELCRPGKTASFERLESELDNIRAGLEWSRPPAGGAAEMGLRLAGALAYFWWMSGRLGEGCAQLTAFLSLPEAAPRNRARARALYALGLLTLRQGHPAAGFQAARTCFTESVAIYRELGDRRGAAAVLGELGRMSIEVLDFAAARPLLEESLVLQRQEANGEGIAASLAGLGCLEFFGGNYGAARAPLEEVLGVLREAADAWYVGVALYFLGRLACEEGDHTGARARFVELLEVLPPQQYRWAAPALLEAFVHLAIARGQMARGLRIAGAAQVLRDIIEVRPSPAFEVDLQRRLEVAREALGPADADEAWADGRALTLEQALGEALAD